MGTWVDADGVIEMVSKVETDPESEDSIYDNLDSKDSGSSRECDHEPENDEDDNTDDESEEYLDESKEWRKHNYWRQSSREEGEGQS